MNDLLKHTLGMLVATCAFAGAAHADGVDQLPGSEQAIYAVVDPQIPLGASVYKDFKPKKGPPWRIGYASSYAGNTWRAAALDAIMSDLLPRSKEAGLISEVVVTQSDLKDAVQIQQMRQMVDDGVDAIIICCSNVTALNQTIEYAYKAGVPVFSFSGYVTSPYAINGAANHAQGGREMAAWLAEKIGKKGNVLLVSGIPGFASSDSFDKAAKEALATYPDINIVGEVAGKWTDQVAQVEVQKFLATNPTQIDGILTQGAQENGVLNAMLQSGRPMVPITLGGEASAACYWRKNPDWVDASFHIWPPRREMQQMWEIMLRTLQGQGPKVQSFLRPVLPYSIEDVKATLPEDCDLNSTDFVEPKADGWFPAGIADQYFELPADPWKPVAK
ncbi:MULTISPECIES: ABC transporter substrate-binding protein [unclassified Ensifer]|uniref:ABC transporter substrate-binding protein n=1 Tax=unclassified Ensifer TaxID=2633371 RepID=UPI000712527D|nr:MULTISPECIES: ABC transporter substrate-binding protein [unclassified Ensifer]KQX43197.1 sugar ABC transporter substrate-binding protein [Ensifer sp. Root1298]KQX72746.1 sugar ABC transporter substrate-binding protein [Ensifer sp. Root1312]KRC15712.1 sugar ABC transporter substrate-binding protein [Ensifer sp. Root74]KRD58987.1 sugar ABC transporter substrate-binding protein [Ensifer sp. Root954]